MDTPSPSVPFFPQSLVYSPVPHHTPCGALSPLFPQARHLNSFPLWHSHSWLCSLRIFASPIGIQFTQSSLPSSHSRQSTTANLPSIFAFAAPRRGGACPGRSSIGSHRPPKTCALNLNLIPTS